MNYKELIEQLKEWDEYFISEACGRRDLKCEDYCTVVGKDCLVIQSITAIQNLLAERDAAVGMLYGQCHACKHNTGWHNRGKCINCVHETARFLKKEDRKADNWKWRGPVPDRKPES